LTTGIRVNVVPSVDARGRLLAELAAGPARRGYAIAYDLLGARAEAEEAVQEALARACENIGDLRDPVAAPAWFLRIVTTTCLRQLRRRKLRKAIFGRFSWFAPRDDGDSGDAAPADEPVGSDPASAPPSVSEIAELVHAAPPAPAPADALLSRERLTALLRSLDDLSPQQRTALVLRYGHDTPVPEIAQMLGVELATAKTHLVRGLARLRDLMEEHR
jgi:RNA polymerase sigma-70 factor (ECF subfamily)